MPNPAPTKKETSVTMPYKKITTRNIENMQWRGSIEHILHLPGGQRIITYSWHGSFRVCDLKTGAQVGDEWEDKEEGVKVIALSPDRKTLASGSEGGAVKLWNIDTGKVIKKWTGHTKEVVSVCWSSDGGRMVSGSSDGIFRAWDVESSRTILGPIQAEKTIYVVCYSPDAKVVATGGHNLKVWDANTGELLTTIKRFVKCLVWTSDGKTLITWGFSLKIRIFDTTTWSETAVLNLKEPVMVDSILLSPNERILASTSFFNKTTQLWNLETNQPLELPLHHEDRVTCATFSVDGMFLLIASSGNDAPIYKWDLSAIVKDASLLSDLNNVDVTRQPASKIKDAPPRRIPPGFFDDTRRADLSTSRTQSHGQHESRSLGRFPSFWRRRPFKQNRATEHGMEPWSRPFNWSRNLVSGMVRRRDGSDIKLREPPIVEVPCTAGKPRNYHARIKKPTASSLQPVYAHTTQQHTAPQDTPPPPSSSSHRPTSAVTASTPRTTGIISHPHIPITGWRARLIAWVCCIPIQSAD